MNIRKIAFFALFLPLVFAQQAQASGTSCTAIYGGGYKAAEKCSHITIDKKVQKPGSKDFVDGLSSNDPKYAPGQQITFQLVVTNDGSETLSDVNVVDTLPDKLSYVAGPGNYNKDAKTLTIHIDTLASGESKTFLIVTKAAEEIAELDKGFLCVNNTVRVTDKSGANATDSSTVCIEKTKVVYPPQPVKKTPPTGPADAAFPLLVSMAGAGMYLKYKTQAMIVKKRGGVTK